MADNRLEEMRRRYAEAHVGGGEERIAKQHQAGKLTARERVETLCDPGSFQEYDALVVHRNRDAAVPFDVPVLLPPQRRIDQHMGPVEIHPYGCHLRRTIRH